MRPGRMPRETESGVQSGSVSSSAKQKVYLPGLPCIARFDFARPAAADIADDELEGPADGRVGPVALAERVQAPVSCRCAARRGRSR